APILRDCVHCRLPFSTVRLPYRCRTAAPAAIGMSIEIHKKGVLKELEARREPYWGAPLDKGRHLGVRKLANGSCVWIAKLRDDDGKHRTRSLGQATKDFDYGPAKRAAEEWFATFDVGVTDKPPT